jgi:hypothetical protein
MIEVHTESFKETRPREYLVRFVFGGVACVLAGLMAKAFGAAVGGLFLAFPAIFPCSVTLIESHEKRKLAKKGKDGTGKARHEAGTDAAGTALGCVALAVFALLLWQLLPRWTPILALLAATAGWALVSVGLWAVLYRNRI